MIRRRIDAMRDVYKRQFMRRVGYIIEEIVEPSNMEASFRQEMCIRDRYGGVSMSYANNDSLFTNTNIGSRLAFRGRLVKAASVAAFKSISEVA